MAFSSDPLLWWREAWPSGLNRSVPWDTSWQDNLLHLQVQIQQSNRPKMEAMMLGREEQICGFLCYCQHGTNTIYQVDQRELLKDLWWKSFQPWTSKLRLCVSHESNDQDPLAMSRNVAIRLQPPQYPGHQNSLRMLEGPFENINQGPQFLWKHKRCNCLILHMSNSVDLRKKETVYGRTWVFPENPELDWERDSGRDERRGTPKYVWWEKGRAGKPGHHFWKNMFAFYINPIERGRGDDHSNQQK